MHENSEVMAKVSDDFMMWDSREVVLGLRDLMVRLTSQVSVTSQGETHSEVNVSMIFVVIRGSFLLDLAYWKTVVYICLYINPNFDK